MAAVLERLDDMSQYFACCRCQQHKSDRNLLQKLHQRCMKRCCLFFNSVCVKGGRGGGVFLFFISGFQSPWW